jgi:hypothetical protein
MSFLEVHNVSKDNGQSWKRSEVLRDINLSIEEGEFVLERRARRPGLTGVNVEVSRTEDAEAVSAATAVV